MNRVAGLLVPCGVRRDNGPTSVGLSAKRKGSGMHESDVRVVKQSGQVVGLRPAAVGADAELHGPPDPVVDDRPDQQGTGAFQHSVRNAGEGIQLCVRVRRPAGRLAGRQDQRSLVVSPGPVRLVGRRHCQRFCGPHRSGTGAAGRHLVARRCRSQQPDELCLSGFSRVPHGAGIFRIRSVALRADHDAAAVGTGGSPLRQRAAAERCIRRRDSDAAGGASPGHGAGGQLALAVCGDRCAGLDLDSAVDLAGRRRSPGPAASHPCGFPGRRPTGTRAGRTPGASNRRALCGGGSDQPDLALLPRLAAQDARRVSRLPGRQCPLLYGRLLYCDRSGLHLGRLCGQAADGSADDRACRAADDLPGVRRCSRRSAPSRPGWAKGRCY